jgi:hypothetical protein
VTVGGGITWIVLGYRPAAAVGWIMLACASMGGLSVLCAGLFFVSIQYAGGHQRAVRHQHPALQPGHPRRVRSAAQLFPDGLLPGLLWQVLFPVSVILIVVPRLMHA